MRRAVRAGLIGLGMMGRHHARVLSETEGIDFIAAVDPAGDPHRVAAHVDVHPDIASLLRGRIDLCIVATPTASHLEAGLALAEAGVHTLIEKPLAHDVASARELAEAFDRQGLVGCVGHVERYNPALLALRDRLDAGEVGDVFQVATRRQGPFPNRIADVGVVKDLATHDIDLTAWVTRQQYRSVAAHTAHRSGREHEDLIAITATLAGGTVVSHLVNWLSPMKERVTIVTGERGCFVADTLAADLTFFENGQIPTEWDAIARFRGVSEGNMTRYAIAKPEPLKTEIENFRDAVLGRDSDVVTMRQGLTTLAVAEACLSAARDGNTVALRSKQTGS